MRYEHEQPGDLIHVDIKKLGRIPDGGGHRKLGRQTGRKNRSGVGYAYLHHAVDDHSRLAYSEILGDEKKETAASFWERANTSFTAAGVTVKRVLTDNGSCYRSQTFRDALATEGAYAQTYSSDAARAATYPDWLHQYNRHRPDTGIGGSTPASRVNDNNAPGDYT